MLEHLAQSNAAQWGTHIRRRNRKRSDGAVAVLRSGATALCACVVGEPLKLVAASRVAAALGWPIPLGGDSLHAPACYHEMRRNYCGKPCWLRRKLMHKATCNELVEGGISRVYWCKRWRRARLIFTAFRRRTAHIAARPSSTKHRDRLASCACQSRLV